MSGQISQKFSSYGVQASALSVGSTAPIANVVNVQEALRFVRNVEAEPASNECPLAYEVVDYKVPLGVEPAAYPAYQAYRDTLVRWNFLGAQVAERCRAFDRAWNPAYDGRMADAAGPSVGGQSLESLCSEIKGSLAAHKQNCEMTESWAKCVRPDA